MARYKIFSILFLTILVQCFAKHVDHCEKSVTTCSGPFAPKHVCAGKLIFEDNFDDFDMKKWQHELTLGGGGNWEFQWYTNNRSNSFAQDGKLHIRPTLTADHIGEENLSSMTLDITGTNTSDECTNSQWQGCIRTGSPKHVLNPIKSARLRTIDSFSFKYGTVEVKAKLPAGDWLWPAIWLLPTKQVYDSWPRSGEIDMMESRGNKHYIVNGKNLGPNQIGSTLHWGPDWRHNAYERTHYDLYAPEGQSFDTEFKVYKMEWTPEFIKFYVDDSFVGNVQPNTSFWKFAGFDKTDLPNIWINGTDMAPFDQEFHLILNLAVGGVNGYFPDNAESVPPKPWKNSSPTSATDFWKARSEWLPTWKMDENNGESSSLLIDYVKVWAL